MTGMMREVINVGLIVGTTRPGRFADTAVRWLEEASGAWANMSLQVLDLREYRLPFFNEPVAPVYTGGAYSEPAAETWRRRLDTFDAFIATVAEYNHGPAAVLKNAFDSAYLEWQKKPIAFLGYGGVGAARAVEHLRGIVIELDMVPIKQGVAIGMEPYLGVVRNGRTLSDYDYLVQSRQAMFENLLWWGRILKAARRSINIAATAAA